MKRTALIVEDESDIGLLLAEAIRRRGFQPTLLQEGMPVVRWVRDNRPDLILLDLMLPDRSGYEICHELKLDRQTNLTPIIMVTSRHQHKDKVHGLEVGANYYLVKPFTVTQLYDAVDQVLAWRDDLAQRGTSGEIHFQLASDTQHLDELNQLLGSLFLFTALSEDQIRQLTTAVREMGVNAIEWGHRKQLDRLVTITYRIDADKVEIVIQDTGPGFDPASLPHAADPEDPTAHMAVRQTLGMRDGGFGILMARGLVDELQYNQRGNEVRLIKRFAPLPAATTRP